MFVPENAAGAVGKQILKSAEQLAIEQAEKAIAEQSAKAKEVVETAQKAAQMYQAANSTISGLQALQQPTPFPATEDTNAAMMASDLFGIIHVVALKIIIDGQVFTNFESFQLQQSTSSHHTFQLVLQHDILAAAQDHTMEDARAFLSSRISVTFSYKSVLKGSPEREFIGVITQVGFAQSQGGRGSIVLTGKSPTALLDAAPHTQSFGGEKPISLNSIAQEVIKQGLGESRFDVFVKPAYTGNLLYSSQYNESHHNYLARMAAAYGEWYFYDGRVLCFGKPTPANPIRLAYGKDTEEVQLQMKAQHVNRQHYGYNSNNHVPLKTGSTPATGLGELGMYAHDTSQKAFIAPSLVYSPIRAVTDKDVETTQKGAVGAAAADVFTLSGKTSVPFLYPGCVIEMNFRNPGSSEVKYFSKLIVTDISHSVDARGNYAGHFDAIPAETEYLPEPAYVMPVAEPQMAKVKDNKDKQGRIRVQFDWQKGSDTTDFIRMMSPDAGGSEKVTKNRGFMAIPEIGDQVMVGFVHNHPDRPFAMGGMFHGKVGAGGGSGNHVKSITGRSGATVVIHDGAGSVLVKDAHGNFVHLHGNGEITVKSSVKVTIDSKDIVLNASHDITMTAGNNIDLNASNVNINATAGAEGGGGMIVAKAQKNAALQSLEDSVNITSNAMAIYLNAATTLNAEAPTQILIKSGDTQIF